MLTLLIDENFNQRILRGLRRCLPHLDFVIAQEVGLKGSQDPDVLARAAEDHRVLVTHDLKTIPRYAYLRVKELLPMPGVVAIPDHMPIGQAIQELALVVETCEGHEMENSVLYLPL